MGNGYRLLKKDSKRVKQANMLSKHRCFFELKYTYKNILRTQLSAPDLWQLLKINCQLKELTNIWSGNTYNLNVENKKAKETIVKQASIFGLDAWMQQRLTERTAFAERMNIIIII